MDELKRKVDMLSVLNRKSDIDVKGLLKKFNASKERFNHAKESLDVTQREIKSCNIKITEEYQLQINVDTIALLNRYAEKLENEARQKQAILKGAQEEMEQARNRLERELVKGFAYSKSLENVSVEYSKCLEKAFDRNVEDIWLARKGRT